MFYQASRLFWLLFSPATFLVLLTVIGVMALFTRFARRGRALLTIGVGLYVLCGFGPAGDRKSTRLNSSHT